MKKRFAPYRISLKILLRSRDRVLFLKTANGKFWDLPGGRIDNTESAVSLENILDREIREELRKNIKYELDGIVFVYRKPVMQKQYPTLLVVYGGEYLSGNIRLSPEHSRYAWLIAANFEPKKHDFMYSEEYLAFKNYFGNHQWGKRINRPYLADR